MTISILIDPCAPYRLPPVLAPTPIRPARPARPAPAHPLDRLIQDTLESAGEPMGVWQMLNEIAKSAGPANSMRVQRGTRP